MSSKQIFFNHKYLWQHLEECNLVLWKWSLKYRRLMNDMIARNYFMSTYL